MRDKNYYEVLVVLTTLTDGSKVKQIKETYLVDAVSVTDAEAKVTKDFEGTQFEWEVKAVKESKIIRTIN